MYLSLVSYINVNMLNVVRAREFHRKQITRRKGERKKTSNFITKANKTKTAKEKQVIERVQHVRKIHADTGKLLFSL